MSFELRAYNIWKSHCSLNMEALEYYHKVDANCYIRFLLWCFSCKSYSVFYMMKSISSLTFSYELSISHSTGGIQCLLERLPSVATRTHVHSRSQASGSFWCGLTPPRTFCIWGCSLPASGTRSFMFLFSVSGTQTLKSLPLWKMF